MRNATRWILFLSAMFASNSPSGAAPILLYNTGMNNSTSPLAGGAADPHYKLISSPSAGSATAVVASNIPGNYIPNGPNSQWIGPAADLTASSPVGNYVYQTTFDLTGLNASSAVIIGQFASDNEGSILLNGISTGITDVPAEFNSFTSFTISSGFVAGLNTLSFLVTNDAVNFAVNPSGLRVELSGTANAASVPEPHSLLLLVGSIGLLGCSPRCRAGLRFVMARD